MQDKNFSKEQLIISGFLTLATEFLDLAENIFEEIIKGGNPHVVSGDYPIKEGEYENITKWSDFKIFRPTLFCFYHGMELLMKGVLGLVGENFNFKHKLTGLLDSIDKNYEISNVAKCILRRHIDINQLVLPHLKKFLEKNSLSINDLYESLRYPSNNALNALFNDIDFKYQEADLLPFLKTLKDDSHSLRVEIIKLYRSKE